MDAMDDHPRHLADLAARIDARCRLTGEFTLRSGQRSDTYFDKYRFEADPALLRRLAEGAEITGRRVVVVEDVISTGGQVVRSVADLRAAGAAVTDVLCVIDRRPAAAEDLLGGAGLRLHALLTRADLDAAAAAAG
jgi:orotate phosphoribosyltransferase